MTTDIFKFDDICGRPAALEINGSDTHMTITWGALTVADMFGEVGFWRSFHKKHGLPLKGAAHTAALRAHALAIIELEIYDALREAQQMIAEGQA